MYFPDRGCVRLYATCLATPLTRCRKASTGISVLYLPGPDPGFCRGGPHIGKKVIIRLVQQSLRRGLIPKAITYSRTQCQVNANRGPWQLFAQGRLLTWDKDLSQLYACERVNTRQWHEWHSQPLESTRHAGNYFVPLSIRPIFIFVAEVMSNYLTTDGLKNFFYFRRPLRPEARGICHICHMVNPALVESRYIELQGTAVISSIYIVRYAALKAVDQLSGTSIDGTDRRTDGHPIVTQTLHSIFCTQRQ